MDRIFHSWAKVQSSSLTKRNRFSSGKNAQNTRRRLCFSALWWLCEPENNIYRASHLTSFITKSHTPASPMKLGVNPSSASLFSFSPSPRDPGLYLPSSHLHSRKRTRKEKLWCSSATLVAVCDVKVTRTWIIKDTKKRLEGCKRGAEGDNLFLLVGEYGQAQRPERSLHLCPVILIQASSATINLQSDWV